VRGTAADSADKRYGRAFSRRVAPWDQTGGWDGAWRTDAVDITVSTNGAHAHGRQDPWGLAAVGGH
jgi:hypothetical protein